MRARMLCGWLAFALAAGCAHKPPPPPPPAPPPTAPPPPGETLRFRATAGDEPHARVKLTIDQDQTRTKAGAEAGPPQHLSLAFEFADEERVEQLAADGTASFSARLVDAVGKVSEGGNQKLVDDFALALDDLKIRFQRAPRGEVTALLLSGLPPPLEEGTARAMLNALYSSQRGNLLPEQPTVVGGGWKVETLLPPSTGFTGLVSYEYTLARKGGGVAVITCRGTVEGKGASGGRTMTGKSSGEYRLEVETGRLIGSVVDSDVLVDQQVGTPPTQLSVKQHVHAEWTLVDANQGSK